MRPFSGAQPGSDGTEFYHLDPDRLSLVRNLSQSRPVEAKIEIGTISSYFTQESNILSQTERKKCLLLFLPTNAICQKCLIMEENQENPLLRYHFFLGSFARFILVCMIIENHICLNIMKYVC